MLKTNNQVQCPVQLNSAILHQPMRHGHERVGSQTVCGHENANHRRLFHMERGKDMSRHTKAQPGRVRQTQIIRQAAVRTIPKFHERGKTNGTGQPDGGGTHYGGTGIFGFVKIGLDGLDRVQPLSAKQWAVPEISRHLGSGKASERGEEGKRMRLAVG